MPKTTSLEILTNGPGKCWTFHLGLNHLCKTFLTPRPASNGSGKNSYFFPGVRVGLGTNHCLSILVGGGSLSTFKRLASYFLKTSQSLLTPGWNTLAMTKFSNPAIPNFHFVCFCTNFGFFFLLQE